MKLRLLLFVAVAVACQSREKEEVEAVLLNTDIQSVVQFAADSLADCPTWLAKDDRLRTFFAEDDSAAELLTEHFTHDQIVSWFQSMDTTSMLNLAAYLEEEHLPFVSTKDSIQNCATTINTVVFSHQQMEAILLLVEIQPAKTQSFTLLLERPSVGEQWYVADTLSQTSTPN
jgi:hypothetical protein